MPAQEILILAFTRMRSGLCTAGFCSQRDPVSCLRWVRPVKEHSSLQLGDLTDRSGRVIQCGDVIELEMLRPRSEPPHVEDWICDWVRHRPRLLRRLEGDRWARLLANHVDREPADVMLRHTRSLCLVHPDEVWAHFHLDRYSGKYDARLGFRIAGVEHAAAASPRGVTVTDIKWRAQGRAWLGDVESELTLTRGQLLERLAANDLFLALGLSRGFQGEYWLLVVGVHVVPDYSVTLDYAAV